MQNKEAKNSAACVESELKFLITFLVAKPVKVRQDAGYQCMLKVAEQRRKGEEQSDH